MFFAFFGCLAPTHDSPEYTHVVYFIEHNLYLCFRDGLAEAAIHGKGLPVPLTPYEATLQFFLWHLTPVLVPYQSVTRLGLIG